MSCNFMYYCLPQEVGPGSDVVYVSMESFIKIVHKQTQENS